MGAAGLVFWGEGDRTDEIGTSGFWKAGGEPSGCGYQGRIDDGSVGDR